jgi:hypothetical protein
MKRQVAFLTVTFLFWGLIAAFAGAKYLSAFKSRVPVLPAAMKKEQAELKITPRAKKAAFFDVAISKTGEVFMIGLDNEATRGLYISLVMAGTAGQRELCRPADLL